MERTRLVENAYPFSFYFTDDVEERSLTSHLQQLTESKNKIKKSDYIESFISKSEFKSSVYTNKVSESSLNTTLEKENYSYGSISQNESILISMLQSEYFETGVSAPSEEYFSALLAQNRMDALNCITKIFMDNFSKSKQANILVGILHMISHFSYESVYPSAQAIAMVALNHKNVEVSEYAIKCFENWGHNDGAEKLKAVSFSAKWLQEYADDVIIELERGRTIGVVS